MGSIGVVTRGVFQIYFLLRNLKARTYYRLSMGIMDYCRANNRRLFQDAFSWKYGFYLFSIIVALLTILVFIYIPETISKKSKLSINKVRKDITEVITNKEFMTLSIVMGIAYSLIITFNTLVLFLNSRYNELFSRLFWKTCYISRFCFFTSTNNWVQVIRSFFSWEDLFYIYTSIHLINNKLFCD